MGRNAEQLNVNFVFLQLQILLEHSAHAGTDHAHQLAGLDWDLVWFGATVSLILWQESHVMKHDIMILRHRY